MLRKEFSVVLRQINIFSLVILSIPAILLIFFHQPYYELFIPIFQFGLFFLALFMGASLFSGFRRQKEIEYLLTLPYSRIQLIGLKLLPRLTAFLFFFVAYLILYMLGGDYYEALSFVSFTAIYFSLFLIALCFSANSDNFLVIFLTSLLFFVGLFGLYILVNWLSVKIMGEPGRWFSIDIRKLFTGEAEFSEPVFLFSLLTIIIFLLPFVISFIHSFKKTEVRPAKVYNKRYFKLFVVIFAICFASSIGFSYLGMYIEFKSLDSMFTGYYLTQDHKLIECGFYHVKVHEENNVHKFKGIDWYYWNLLDENEYVYFLEYDEVSRLNTSDYSYEALYAVPSGTRGRGSWKYNQTIILIEMEKKQKGIRIVLINEASEKVEKIPIEHELLKGYYNPTIFGTDTGDGKRFWLICSGRVWNYPILKVWEDGEVENIGKSQIWPCYVNQMLITYSDKETFISKEKESKFEIVRKISNKDGLRFSFRVFRNNLNNIPIKEMYTMRAKKIFRLNLETFDIEEIEGFKEYFRFFYPDHYYFVKTDREANERKLYQLKDGEAKLLKSFSFKKGERYFLLKNGIIIEEGKKIKVFAFPDLREIEFKEL